MKLDNFIKMTAYKKEVNERENLKISSAIILKCFGSGSEIYSNFMKEFVVLYNELKHSPEPFTYFDEWIKGIEKYYGGKPDYSLVFNHIYLILIGKLILYLKIKVKLKVKAKIY